MAERVASDSGLSTSFLTDSPRTSPEKGKFIGNVSSCVPLPEEYKGPVMKGHLIFDACYEGGNLGRVDYINEFEYDLFIRPDTCNSRYRVWFNFSITNIISGQRVILNIVNFSKTKSLYRNGMSPLVKSTTRPKWLRVPSQNVFYYRSPDHNKNYVMSFAFEFDNEEDSYQFAYCYPYTYTTLHEYLNELESNQYNYCKRETLCYTVQQRSLDLLTITDPDNLVSDVRKKIIFITSRIHPGETPSSYVCQGLIDYLISDDPGAVTLRKHLVFKIIPMLNPDGVYVGNYRSSLMGFDLNRHWHSPSPWAQPSLHATKKLLMEYDKDPNVDLDFYIDIHAHSILTNGFMYCNVYDDEKRLEREAVFPRLLCKRAPDFSWSKTSFNSDAVKFGTGRRCLGSTLDMQTHCYTLEVSFYCFIHHDTNTLTPYRQEHYNELGCNLGRTFLDYYKL